MQFIRESNRIEGIVREPTKEEVIECDRFIHLSEVTINDLVNFVKIYQPGASLRDKVGMDVTVNNYLPPSGGADIRKALIALLNKIQKPETQSRPLTPYEAHQEYQSLHPFMDANGRSGRMLWLWMMKGNAPLGFLHTWYYQSLNEYTQQSLRVTPVLENKPLKEPEKIVTVTKEPVTKPRPLMIKKSESGSIKVSGQDPLDTLMNKS